ncbi:4Fe-4S ferredoxin [Pseudodesulfovibrio tunisiensis]|uniref:4Fe-4S ferredoxin n=1 Tax=Pseudodesulfovibrio tunisiensis TaxID=463192 RepID=UPI001FB26762|nr:4Fe-4S ferredoxin [Pseudodesulfovibrio tunisiensis]
MKTRAYPRWISRLYVFAMTVLGVTGLAQMPLARRYYISDLPGLGWLADFFMVHKVHYVAAAALLFVVGLVVANWLSRWKGRLGITPMGKVRLVLLAGLILTGGLRVTRNLPDVFYSPEFVILFDWTHLLLAMLIGVAALVALVRGRSAYAEIRD